MVLSKKIYVAITSLLTTLMLVISGHSFANEPIIVAAADLKFALDEVAKSFKQDTAKSVNIIYGSSGTFATQIRSGAPFQMYLSADEDFIFKLHSEGLTRDQGHLYAIGRIVLVAPKGSNLSVDSDLTGLAAQLKSGKITRFAIANPEHAPYGRRAEEVLKKKGLWEAIHPKLILGENVAQTAQFALSGSAQGGIIALSLAKAPQMAELGTFALIPAEWHEPLRQRMVLLKNADSTTEAFYQYLQQPTARTIMRRYGFSLPGDPN